MPKEKPSKIRIDPDPVLRKKTEELSPAEIKSPETKKLIKKMTEALKDSKNGVGLAAPQIGVLKALFIVSEFATKLPIGNPEKPKEEALKTEFKVQVFINPKIIKRSQKKELMYEGCLSTPDIYGEIKRSRQVTIEAFNEKSKKNKKGAGGLLSEIFQHEIDHLNGILFIDNAINLRKFEPTNEK